MMQDHHFDVLIVVTPADCERLLPLYPRLLENFENGNICFIGTPQVWDIVTNSPIADNSKWVNENDILPFDEVYACMVERLEPILKGEPLPRGVTGWYYQQFLKMQYANSCKDDYYMAWDGDTIPCRKISMFSPDTGQPYLDLKHEYHAEYFDTIGKILPGMSKVIERSFISEHMLFRCDIIKNLIADIERNDSLQGKRFWEKIINSIEPVKIYDSSFSEFETYGTYVALKYNDVYRLREWHSFRLGGSFYEVDTITDRDFRWLGVDFDAISFEKGQAVLEENKGYFDNPEVQQKISARKLLQAAQMEYQDAYKEVWEDDPDAARANIRTGGYWDRRDGKEDAVGGFGKVSSAMKRGDKSADADVMKENPVDYNAFSEIPFTQEEQFTILCYGCGCGENMSTLKSHFPNSILYGIEPKSRLYENGQQTERVFESIDEVLDCFDDPFVDVLLMTKECWNSLDSEEQEILNALMLPDGVKVLTE